MRVAVIWVVLGNRELALSRRDVAWARGLFRWVECKRREVEVSKRLKRWKARQVKGFDTLPARYRHVMALMLGEEWIWSG